MADWDAGAAGGAAAAGTTPSPGVDAWLRMFDPTRKEYYYYNPETGVSQWEAPPDYQPATGTVLDDASDAALKIQCMYRSWSARKRCSAIEVARLTGARVVGGGRWYEHMNAATGTLVYTEVTTGRVAPTTPLEVLSKTDAQLAGAVKIREVMKASKDSDAVRRHIAQLAQTDAVRITWIRQWDPSNQAYYYYNCKTGESVWDQPPDFVEGGSDEMCSAAVRIQCMFRQRQARRRMDNMGFATSSKRKGEPDAEAEQKKKAEEPKPVEWVKQWDPQNQAHYYYNIVTGMSQWNEPSDFREGGAAPQLEAATKLQSMFRGSLARSKTKAAKVSTNMTQSEDRRWIRQWDGANRRWYYFNIETRGFQVEEPAGFVPGVKDPMVEAVIRIQCAFRTAIARKRVEVKRQALRLVQLAKRGMFATLESDVAIGWVKMFDEASNREYYYNSKTGGCVWDKPPDYVEGAGTNESLAAAMQIGAVFRSHKARAEADTMLEAALKTSASLPVWVKGYHPKKQVDFYYNTQTKKTVYDRPPEYVEGADADLVLHVLKIQCMYRVWSSRRKVTAARLAASGLPPPPMPTSARKTARASRPSDTSAAAAAGASPVPDAAKPDSSESKAETKSADADAEVKVEDAPAPAPVAAEPVPTPEPASGPVPSTAASVKSTASTKPKPKLKAKPAAEPRQPMSLDDKEAAVRIQAMLRGGVVRKQMAKKKATPDYAQRRKQAKQRDAASKRLLGKTEQARAELSRIRKDCEVIAGHEVAHLSSVKLALEGVDEAIVAAHDTLNRVVGMITDMRLASAERAWPDVENNQISVQAAHAAAVGAACVGFEPVLLHAWRSVQDSDRCLEAAGVAKLPGKSLVGRIAGFAKAITERLGELLVQQHLPTNEAEFRVAAVRALSDSVRGFVLTQQLVQAVQELTQQLDSRVETLRTEAERVAMRLEEQRQRQVEALSSKVDVYREAHDAFVEMCQDAWRMGRLMRRQDSSIKQADAFGSQRQLNIGGAKPKNVALDSSIYTLGAACTQGVSTDRINLLMRDAAQRIEKQEGRVWDINGIDDETGERLLHVAAHNGHAHLVRFLLFHGANPNLVNNSVIKWTALHVAARAGHDKVITELLRGGAQAFLQDSSGDTALHWAARRGHLKAVRNLLPDDVQVSIDMEDPASPEIGVFAGDVRDYPPAWRALASVNAKRQTVQDVAAGPGLQRVLRNALHALTERVQMATVAAGLVARGSLKGARDREKVTGGLRPVKGPGGRSTASLRGSTAALRK